tara:strand:+ start:823 stop:942 length:120 start_codon:yes stop_codon:yes gene_type:complete
MAKTFFQKLAEVKTQATKTVKETKKAVKAVKKEVDKTVE